MDFKEENYSYRLTWLQRDEELGIKYFEILISKLGRSALFLTFNSLVNNIVLIS